MKSRMMAGYVFVLIGFMVFPHLVMAKDNAYSVKFQAGRVIIAPEYDWDDARLAAYVEELMQYKEGDNLYRCAVQIGNKLWDAAQEKQAAYIESLYNQEYVTRGMSWATTEISKVVTDRLASILTVYLNLQGVIPSRVSHVKYLWSDQNGQGDAYNHVRTVTHDDLEKIRTRFSLLGWNAKS
ncbi:MAG: hypothetical protein WCI27_00820 [Candidatus Omnitrophota bacterium]